METFLVHRFSNSVSSKGLAWDMGGGGSSLGYAQPKLFNGEVGNNPL